MKKKKCKLSFVIPCYNSSKTIESVVQEIVDTVNKDFDYEIILVNDGSKDNVFDVIKKIAKKNSNIKGISLCSNFGQHSAILTGLKFASGEFVFCLDDDGQTPANECLKLLEKINDGYDAVYAKYNTKQHSWYRNTGSKINDLMATWVLGKPKELYISSYFVCKKYIVDEIIKYNNPYPYIQGLLLRTTKNITNVEVKHRNREIGNSNYSFSKLISLWLNGFTAFSIKPLRIASFIGTVTATIGFLYGIVLVIRKLLNLTVVLGYSSIMAAILFIGGIIMLMLGLIGEYIGRMYISINNSPQAVIKEKINIR